MNATTNIATNPNTERNATRERILRVAGWLTSGVMRHQAVLAALQEWNVSRRTAQVYVQRAAQRIAKSTEYDDPLFAMKLSQLQRDQLFQQLQNLQAKSYEMEPHEIRDFRQTIQAQLKVLDSRDRTAAKIAQLEAKLGRADAGRRAAPAPQQEEKPEVETAPARHEVMLSAARFTRQPRSSRRAKASPDNDIQPHGEPADSPALGEENCASATATVSYAEMT